MFLGFGNNISSALASDITASQTTFQVMPGAGSRFANLLTLDFPNSSDDSTVYAKITITDAEESVFEICHLLSVNGDSLTVIRGQEDTTAKGWSLNDVVSNFATRGSENHFVQIGQLQSGHYTSGVAGGSANALTIDLPATYFINGSTNWVLRSPLVVYPTQNNTGASTLQLTMGGKVLGTFPLYKGNKAELVANDILKDVGLVCLMDKTQTFFNVSNPGAIYAGLGTAAFCDVQTSRDDITPGRVLINGSAVAVRSSIAKANTDLADLSALPANSVSFCYADAAYSPGYAAAVLDVGALNNGYRVQYAASYADGGKQLKFRTLNGDNGWWGQWTSVLTNYGGDVDHLSGSSFYQTNPAAWPGVGTFAEQYGKAAPFHIPFGRFTPKDISQYLPIIKAYTATEGHGFGSAVSFGILRTGNNDFGSAIIHIMDDNGTGAIYKFGYDGTLYVPGQVSSGANIVAGQGVYESGGLVRVYSPNNPPPQQPVDGVQNIALGATGWFSVGGDTTEAPAGCLLTGGGDFGASDGSYFYRPLQITFNNVNWYTVSLLGATQSVSQLSQSDVDEISVQPYALSSVSPVLSKFSLGNSPVSGVQLLNNSDGYEWYRVRNNLDGQVFIAYHEDTGIIEQISENTQALWPVNLAVAALDSLPDGCDILGTWVFDPATMTVSQIPALVASKNKRGPYHKRLRAAGDAYMLLQLLPPEDAEGKITELKEYLAALTGRRFNSEQPFMAHSACIHCITSLEEPT